MTQIIVQDIMNIVMVIVLKILFPYGLSLSNILIHSVIFRNEPINLNNSSKKVLVLCFVPPLLPSEGWGATTEMSNSRRRVAHH